MDNIRIVDLVTPEQYKQLKNEYAALVKNKGEISFFDFCTKTIELKSAGRKPL